MIKKRLKKMIIALLCVALGISTLTPMDDTNAATIVYTRKKTYILSDSAKIKRFTCNAIKRNYNPALKKVSMTFTDEGKYTIKYITGKNKKKTCVVYIDSKKPVVSGVKNGEDYESKVNIKVSDKVSGVASVTLNGKKMSNKFTVSEAGDYKLVAKDKCNNKTVVNFSVIEDEPEETPDVVTAEPNPEDFETPSPEPTEDPNGGTVVIGGTSTPVATSATTTDTPKGTATPNVKTTASPAPTAKETEKPETATATPTMTPTVVPATPTVVPATPTPVPDDLAELDANWKYKIDVYENSITLNDYIGKSPNVYIKKEYVIEGQTLKTILKKAIKWGAQYVAEHGEGPLAAKGFESVEFEDGFDFGENIDYMFWGDRKLTKVVGLKGNIKSMVNTFTDCDAFNQNIVIPSTVTDMEGCFKDCDNFNQQLTIPNEVTSMAYCFMWCQNLQVFPKFGVLSKCESLAGTFKNCEKFNPETIVIPERVNNISSAFSGCKALNIKKIEIPESVKNANYAFEGCTSLFEIDMSYQNADLCEMKYMFYNCSSLQSARLFFGTNVKTIEGIMKGCASGAIVSIISMSWGMADNCDHAFDNCTGSVVTGMGGEGTWKSMILKSDNASFTVKQSTDPRRGY